MELVILTLVGIAVIEVSYLIYMQHTPHLKNKRLAKPVFVDTSVLMDGRVLTAAMTGFVPSRLVIPRSVVSELQLVADSADPDKRSRARRGLDAINELKEIKHVSVEILHDGPVGHGGVDTRLVELAKKHHGYICTIDFNLNKVAQVEGIFVLNINELASNLRMAFLPGEKVSLELIQKGNDSQQAVGYLSDGTMVVVEKAVKDIGTTVEVEFIRALQTAAGRMMFAKKVGKAQDKDITRHSGRKRPSSSRGARKAPKNAEDSLVQLANE